MRTERLLALAAVMMLAIAPVSAQSNSRGGSGSRSNSSSRTTTTTTSSRTTTSSNRNSDNKKTVTTQDRNRTTTTTTSSNSRRPSQASQSRPASSSNASRGDRRPDNHQGQHHQGGQHRPDNHQGQHQQGGQHRPDNHQGQHHQGGQHRPDNHQGQHHQGDRRPSDRSNTTTTRDRNRTHHVGSHHHGSSWVSPRDRGPVHYGAIGHYYGNLPHYYGYRVNRLPARYRIVTYGGYNYYHCDGIYYRRHGSCYYVCRPPVGLFFSTTSYLPALHSVYFFNDSRELDDLSHRLGLITVRPVYGRTYYYDDGVFFVRNGSRYEIVSAPHGAVIDEIPDDYEEFYVGDELLYRVDSTVYAIRVYNGRPRFVVVGQMPYDMANRYYDEYYR